MSYVLHRFLVKPGMTKYYILDTKYYLLNSMKIKTRIAPSPTGLLHIGTARTALYNFLFARANKGEFILRFEDTDKLRSKEKFEKDITAGLKWLGLVWDGKVLYQKNRLKIYTQNIQKLLKSGSAYEKDGALWFKMPYNQSISWNDEVRGKIEFSTSNDKDFVIVRKDGTPLFALSNTIDDYEIDKITHVIRGEDHISNTPRQILIAKALGYQTKIKYAHLPMILNEDKSKMSKRKDPVSVTKDFMEKGYLPEALVNFMALLGWNPGGDKELMTIDEMTKKFNFKRVNKAGAVFDIEKLNWINAQYLKKLSDNELLKQANKYFQAGIDTNLKSRILKVIKDRLEYLDQISDASAYFFKLPKYNKDLLIFKKSDLDSTRRGLEIARDALDNADEPTWNSQDDLNQLLASEVQKFVLSNGDLFWPVRAALSGMEASPSPSELLWVLGKNESLCRIDKAIEKLK